MSEEQAKYLGETPEHAEYQIRDESPHDYFCQIPNLVDELDLTPQAYRLYGHLKRVAGESGKCWQSTKTLSDKCRMSAGAVSEAKKELENTYPPLIRITSKTKENGIYHEIVVTDIWQINHDFWTGGAVHIVKTPRKRSHCENPRSQCETKNNPLIQEEPENGGKPPVSLTAEEIEQATRKADAILGLANPADPSRAWKGRDMMPPELLHYADWYNSATGQIAMKSNRSSWWKALRAWQENGLEVKHLQEAFEARSKWRTVADPNELTKDAAAIKALGSVSKPTPAAPPVTYDENGIPESY